MRSMRKLMVGVALVSMLATACSEGMTSDAVDAPDANNWREQIKGGPLEVGTLSAEGTPGLKLLEGLAGELEKDYKGGEVTLTFANTEARPGIEQRWRGDDPLDVDYNMFDGTNPALLDWADEGFLLDLKPYLEQKDPDTGKPWLDRFDPAVLDFMKHPKTGAIYGVPSELSLQVLFYNAKMFTDLGIKPPTTWDDFLSAVDTLKAGGVDPISLTGLFDPYMGMWIDHLWLRTVGYDKARPVTSEGKGHITDDPGFLQGLEMLQELRDKDAFMEGFQGTDFTPAQASFFQGKTGMILMGSWLVSEMADAIPPDFQLGVLPFPTVPDGKGDQGALMAASQQMSVAAASENIPLALEWMRRLTSVDFQTTRANEIGEVSAVEGVPSPPGIPGIDKVLSGADSLQARDFGINESKAKDVIWPEVAKMLFGEQDAKQTLEKIDQGLRRVYGN